MLNGGESFQSHVSFLTAGVGAPTNVKNIRCNVARSNVGTFTVTATEDIDPLFTDYDLAGSLDTNTAPVVLNIVKSAPATWLVYTSQVSGGATGSGNPPTWKGSASITGVIAVGAGFVPDTDGAVLATQIKYPLSDPATSVRWTVDVTANTYTNAGAGGVTTFSIYKNGVITAATFTVGPGVTGVQATRADAIAFNIGDTFDISASNPGDGNGAHTAVFSVSMDFQNAIITAPTLTLTDTTGCRINLTLKRVDPA